MASTRDISKIQKELAIAQRDIKSTLEKFKSAEGPQKQRFTDMLKKLQEKRKKLDAELEASINDLYADAELDNIDEMKNSRTFSITKLIETIVNRKLHESEDVGRYAVIEKGGSAGSRGKEFIKSGLSGRIIAVFNDKQKAMEYAKEERKWLTPGERSYYKMGYSVVELTPAILKNLKNPLPAVTEVDERKGVRSRLTKLIERLVKAELKKKIE